MDSRHPWQHKYHYRLVHRAVSHAPCLVNNSGWTLTGRSLWFLGVGRSKPPKPLEQTSKEARPSAFFYAGMPAAWYYLFAIIEPVGNALPRLIACANSLQLSLIAGALYILVLPHTYGMGLLPDRYERVTSIIGNTVRGQIVLGGLGSCACPAAPSGGCLS